MEKEMPLEERFESLTLKDNFIFIKVMRDEAACRELLDKGRGYAELPETYIIFLCPFDIFGDKEHAVFTFRNRCEEAEGLELGDGCTKIYYNVLNYGRVDDEQTRNMLEYIAEGTARDEGTRRLERLVERAKRSRGTRRDYMTYEQQMRRMAHFEYDRGVEEGLAEGARQTRVETARNFLVAGVPLQTVADCTGLSLEEVTELQNAPTLEFHS